jgi:hypothetical protein
MSDITWIALIIIVYMLAIKPIMQGMANKPANNTVKQKSEIRKTTPSSKKPADTTEYVDYEEVK